MEAMLYALANKLLNEADLEKIKEEMKMTKLGEMLRADFIEEGREEGRVEGRAEGELRGRNVQLREQIKKKLDKGKSISRIAEELEETEERIRE